MEFENIYYPGFNKTFKDLECSNLVDDNKLEILDYFNIDWVRSAIDELVKVVDSKMSVEFIEPTTTDIDLASKLVKADLSVEDTKKDFNVGKRIIGISSGKGGVGKSTISSLLGMGFHARQSSFLTSRHKHRILTGHEISPFQWNTYRVYRRVRGL